MCRSYASRVAADANEGVLPESRYDRSRQRIVGPRGLAGSPYIDAGWFGLDLTGSTALHDALGSIVKLAPTRRNGGKFYSKMPEAMVASVALPAGAYKLTDYVDTGGRLVNWITAEATEFVDDCGHYLTGRILRPSRISYVNPFGSTGAAQGIR